MSICSQPGVRWIQESTDMPGCKQFLFRLAKDVTCRLNMDIEPSKNRTAEPSKEMAQEYVRGT